jgi:hypothetical protein
LEIIDGYPKFIHEFGVIFKEEYYELMKRFWCQVKLSDDKIYLEKVVTDSCPVSIR